MEKVNFRGTTGPKKHPSTPTCTKNTVFAVTNIRTDENVSIQFELRIDMEFI